MITVIYLIENARFELVVSDPKNLMEALMLLEQSTRISQYKVIRGDCGAVSDFYTTFGWGNGYFTKNRPDGFTYPE